MWILKFVPLTLLAACAAHGATPMPEPAARVVFGDLALDSSSGRAELRSRVAVAARDYCLRHRDEVTPDAFRNDDFDCLERLRSTILTDLPRAVRDAYLQALREAGVRGRRL